MNQDLTNVHFEENRKRQGLTFHEDEDQQVGDKSRKGSVDVRILNLVEEINKGDELFTTSSCSGRAILFTHDLLEESVDDPSGSGESVSLSGIQGQAKTRKKGCRWLFVTHDEIVPQEFLSAWTQVPVGTNCTLKIEPSIFHIQCRNLKGAKKLLNLATESGFRNSGMVIGKDNKMTVAVRSAIGMEVPLTKSVEPKFSDSFLLELLKEGNLKLQTSWERTEAFHQNFSSKF